MAKRARGTTARPGQRAPLPRGGGRPTTPATSTQAPLPRPASLTPEEEARAASLEAEIMAQERAAEEAARRTRDRGRRTSSVRPEPTIRPGGLAVQASQEYAYVARDVRRIALVGGSLVVLLLILWVLAQATGIGRV